MSKAKLIIVKADYCPATHTLGERIVARMMPNNEHEPETLKYTFPHNRKVSMSQNLLRAAIDTADIIAGSRKAVLIGEGSIGHYVFELK